MNLVSSLAINFSRTEIMPRMEHLALIPIKAIEIAIDIIVGIGGLIGVVLTAGLCTSFWHLGQNLTSARYLIAEPFKHLLYVINPHASFSKETSKSSPITTFFEGHILHKIFGLIVNHIEDMSFFKSEVLSRALYVLLALGFTILRIVEVAAGILSATGALLTLGKFEKINDVAFQTLQVPGLIYDLAFCLANVINPKAEFKYLTYETTASNKIKEWIFNKVKINQ